MQIVDSGMILIEIPDIMAGKQLRSEQANWKTKNILASSLLTILMFTAFLCGGLEVKLIKQRKVLLMD